MIAIIVGDEETRRGPIPLALVHAGFEAHQALTTEGVARVIGLHGAENCVLVLDAGCLGGRAGSAVWWGLLTDQRGVATVVVMRGKPSRELRMFAREPHRILLENPFDAAAVVAAARRAFATRRPPTRRGTEQLQYAG